MAAMKRCNACKLELPATREFFSKDSSRSDGLAYRCKACESVAHKSYYKERKKKQRKRAAHDRYSVIRKQLIAEASDGTVTRDELRKLLATWTGVCPLCDREDSKPTIDHIVPLRKGGLHSIGNLRVICLSCNSSLGTQAKLPRAPKSPRSRRNQPRRKRTPSSK